MSDSKLGGLPTLSQGETVTLQPAPVVSFDDATTAFQNLAKAAGDLTNTVASKVSSDQGEQAVTRDASGNIQYKSPGLLSQITGTSAAYVQAAKARYLSESAMDVQPKVAGLKEQFMGNPDGFRAALDSYTGGVLNQTPEEFQAPVRAMIEQQGTSALASLTADKAKSDIEDSKNSQFGLWTSNVNQLYALARQGQVGSDDYKRLLAQAQAVETSLKANPAVNLSREDLAKFDSLVPNLKGEAVVAHAASLYDSSKNEATAEQYLQDNLNDPSLGLSDEEAHTMLSRGLAEIRTRHALEQQDAQQAAYQVEYSADDAYQLALTQGPEARQAFMSDQQIYAAYPHNRPHAQQIIERLNQASDTYQANNALRLANPAQARAYLDKIDPRKGSAPPAVTAPIMPVGEAIFGQESSFGANAKPSVDGSSIGPMQIRPETFAQYARPGESIDNPADNRAVGQRIVDDYSKRYGGDAARVAVAYFSGPGNVAPSSSSTPYLHDYADANGKHVSEYVSDVLGRMGGGGTSPQQDYAAKARTFTAAHAAYDAIQKKLSDDPAKYVVENVPGIADQLNNPKTFQAGIRALITNQKALGVTAPALFTAAGKQSVLNEFSNPPDGVSKAQNTITVLNRLEAQYGSYFPQAMGDLSKGGKLPADIMGIDWVRNSDPVVANRMSDAVNTGRETLSKLLPDGGNGMKTEILTGLADFNGTLKGPGGSAVASQMAQSVQLYAMQLVAEGVQPGPAATQAVQDIIGANFHLGDTYRVPAHVDPGAVQHGANMLKSKLSNVEPYVGAQGVSAGQRQAASASILKSQGVWLTLPDNSGLYLAWPAQSGYARARTAQGQPIQYTWAQLQAASQAPLSYDELSASADKAAMKKQPFTGMPGAR